MQWTRESETEMLSTPIYTGDVATVAKMKECPHDTYKKFGEPEPVPDHPDVKKGMEQCSLCQAFRARLVGPSELLDQIFAQAEGNSSDDD